MIKPGLCGFWAMRVVAVIFVTLLLSPDCFAASPFAKKVDKALKSSCIDRTRTAIRVVEIATGKAVYEHNATKPLIPASVMKLLTSAGALHYLTPGYRFKTKVYYSGRRHGRTIEGDLVLKGGGDPKLTPEIVWRIVQEVKRRGVARVTGDIVVDGSFFDDLARAPAWRKNRSPRAYDAGLAALSVNFNTVAVSVFPGLAPGKPLIVGLDPESSYLKLVNKSKTINKGGREVNISRRKTKNGIEITVTGQMRPGDEPKQRYVTVYEPLKYAGSVFRDFFIQSGVLVEGKVRINAVPAKIRSLYTYESEPLADTLRQLHRYSNNFLAEQITKTMAAEAGGSAPGSHKTAFTLLKGFLDEAGVDTKGMVLADASGLSRENRLSVKTVTSLMEKLYKRFDLWPDFVSTMGIMGMEGSIKNRLKGSPLLGYVRAKTGSLMKVSNLAGLAPDRSGNLYAFSIFLNNNKCGYSGADRIEDRIVDAIFDLQGTR